MKKATDALGVPFRLDPPQGGIAEELKSLRLELEDILKFQHKKPDELIIKSEKVIAWGNRLKGLEKAAELVEIKIPEPRLNTQILYGDNREGIEAISFYFRGQKLYSSNPKHYLILVNKILELEEQIEIMKEGK